MAGIRIFALKTKLNISKYSLRFLLYWLIVVSPCVKINSVNNRIKQYSAISDLSGLFRLMLKTKFFVFVVGWVPDAM